MLPPPALDEAPVVVVNGQPNGLSMRTGILLGRFFK